MDYTKKINSSGISAPSAICTVCQGSCSGGCYGGCSGKCTGDCAGTCKKTAHA